VGGGLVRVLILLPITQQYGAILLAAVACSAVAIVVARRLSTGYIQTLERSLLDRAVELELSDVEDITTRTAVIRTLRTPFTAGLTRDRTIVTTSLTGAVTMEHPVPVGDPEVLEIMALKSRIVTASSACCATRKGCRRRWFRT
jgi:hypothetical protein